VTATMEGIMEVEEALVETRLAAAKETSKGPI
jgi:hypothetical protein